MSTNQVAIVLSMKRSIKFFRNAAICSKLVSNMRLIWTKWLGSWFHFVLWNTTLEVYCAKDIGDIRVVEKNTNV